MQYCSLQHQTLIPSPVTSITGICFCFDSIPSLFLELFLHCSPVAYWAPTDLGSSSFSVLSFCFSYSSWNFQGRNTEVLCHSILQWTTFVRILHHDPSILGGPTQMACLKAHSTNMQLRKAFLLHKRVESILQLINEKNQKECYFILLSSVQLLSRVRLFATP